MLPSQSSPPQPEAVPDGDPSPADASDTFRGIYRDYFDRAEAKRRWSVVDSIPWQDVRTGAVDETLVEILEAFYATEMYLPDYTAKLMQLNRNDQGLAWFLTNWTYEESKHSLAIEEWMIRSESRSKQQMDDFNASLLQSEWHLPFATSRQMLIYALFQELATQLNYVNLSKQTAAAKDPALQRILLLIAGDEGNHHKAFVSCVREHLLSDREGTLRDIAHVLSNFEMPAHDQIPGWDRRGKLIEQAGIYSGRIFIARVMVPGLARLDIDSKTLRPYLKAARDTAA